MGKTKKVGSTGRFGVRYGKTVRKRLMEIESKQKLFYKCPSCHTIKLKRVSTGIWGCYKCNLKFSGKAYTFK